jgi:hypothetical protein
MQNKPPATNSPRDVIDAVARLDLRQAALLAFVIGVLFHACVVYAILDEPQRPAASAPIVAPTSRQATPTPTRLPDRTSCAEIRNTDYRSPAERQWFLANCAVSRAASLRPAASG